MLKVQPTIPSPGLSVSPLDFDIAASYFRTPSPSPSPPMDTLELAPGRGVGPFRLGDSLWAVLDMLRARKTEVPKVEVSWDPDHGSTSAVTVHAGPITLLFPSSREQQLAHILIDGLESAAITLTHNGTVLSSRSHPLTRAGVAFSLGPTYAADGAGRLSYPGVAFKFAPAPMGVGENKDAVVAVEVTSRENEDLPSTGVSQVTLIPGKGAVLDLPDGPVEVILKETSSQDLLLDLGPPLRKYWKEDDRMDRMWGKPVSVNGDSSSNPCFWNYFQYGLDFLIQDATVTKIIAHSNIPGTPQFQQYARCPWIVNTNGGVLDVTSSLSMFRAQLLSEEELRTRENSAPSSHQSTPEPDAAARLAPTGCTGDKKKKKKKHGANGGADMASSPRPSDTEEILRSSVSPSGHSDAPIADAMLLDRSVEGGLDGVLGMSRSQLVGFDGLVVEANEASGAISSIQVWSA